MTLRVAAVDLGATSGRVMAARVGPGHLSLKEVHRFANGGVPAGGSLLWDVLGIHREVLSGIAEVARTGDLHGIGIDSWAVDYGLLDRDGELLGNPYSHRDPRTRDVPELVARTVSAQEQYAVNGLQLLPFNTVYQLVAARGTAALESAHTLLLLPDLLGYWLTGEVGAERTNASTTGLLDVTTGEWSSDLAGRLELPWSILPPLRDAGSVVGPLRAEVAAELGLGTDVPVVAVGSHDTASAVVAVPADTGTSFGYISSGTWSLVGVELDRPVLTDESRRANFTNELGVDGTVRYLRNVMGLWLLQESLRTWELEGHREQLPALLLTAAALPAGGPVIDPDDPVFLPPGDMPARIAAACQRTDQPVPRTRPALVRCILDSLADAYGRAIRDASRLSGRSVGVVHIVGGGAQNALLCQLTADACEVTVIAGPVEATALGNALVQARAAGLITGDLEALRALVRSTQDIRQYEPRASTG
jgi:sugar (pentulose or hexulose) kinase